MNNIYNPYFKLINEFNENNEKWILYETYKQIKIYVNREHLLNNIQDTSRTVLLSFNNITYIRYLVKLFLKTRLKNNTLKLLIFSNNPQSLFFNITFNSLLTEKIHNIYFTCDLQYNYKKKIFQISINTILPNIDENGNPIEPYHASSDIIINMNI